MATEYMKVMRHFNFGGTTELNHNQSFFFKFAKFKRLMLSSVSEGLTKF